MGDMCRLLVWFLPGGDGAVIAQTVTGSGANAPGGQTAYALPRAHDLPGGAGWHDNTAADVIRHRIRLERGGVRLSRKVASAPD